MYDIRTPEKDDILLSEVNLIFTRLSSDLNGLGGSDEYFLPLAKTIQQD